MAIDIECFLLDSANGIAKNFPESIRSTYGNDIDMDCLSLRYQMLSNSILYRLRKSHL